MLSLTSFLSETIWKPPEFKYLLVVVVMRNPRDLRSIWAKDLSHSQSSHKTSVLEWLITRLPRRIYGFINFDKHRNLQPLHRLQRYVVTTCLAATISYQFSSWARGSETFVGKKGSDTHFDTVQPGVTKSDSPRLIAEWKSRHIGNGIVRISHCQPPVYCSTRVINNDIYRERHTKVITRGEQGRYWSWLESVEKYRK